MRHFALPGLLTLLVCVGGASAETVDLLTALDNGLVAAEFRGAGGAMVTGTVERLTPQPLDVVIEPGTHFYAQFGGGFGGGFRGGVGGGRGFQGQRGGGVQGMSTFGATPVDLRTTTVAYVRVPTCCTDFGLREPGPNDVLVAGAPRKRETARVAAVTARRQSDHRVAQLAIWAVANDIPKWGAERYVRELTGGRLSRAEVKETTLALITDARTVVETAGLDAKQYRLFK